MNRSEKLDRLIAYLAPDAPIPEAETDKWRLFRALANVREPGPVDDAFLRVQDDLLRAEIAKKGVTDIDDIQPIRDALYLWKGDITTLKVDAIVNAANSGMTGCYCPNHRCIDNAVHTYAGVQLRNECAAVMQAQGFPEPVGQAKITSAYNLPCRYILHTVGPYVESKVAQRHREQLASCYRACLALATKHSLRSIAFCCISTGEFHFPRAIAARIAVDCVRAVNPPMRVVFNVFSDEDYDLYASILGNPERNGFSTPGGDHQPDD